MLCVLGDEEGLETVEETAFVVAEVTVAGDELGPVPLFPPSTEIKLLQNLYPGTLDKAAVVSWHDMLPTKAQVYSRDRILGWQRQEENS